MYLKSITYVALLSLSTTFIGLFGNAQFARASERITLRQKSNVDLLINEAQLGLNNLTGWLKLELQYVQESKMSKTSKKRMICESRRSYSVRSTAKELQYLLNVTAAYFLFGEEEDEMLRSVGGIEKLRFSTLFDDEKYKGIKNFGVFCYDDDEKRLDDIDAVIKEFVIDLDKYLKDVNERTDLLQAAVVKSLQASAKP